MNSIITVQGNALKIARAKKGFSLRQLATAAKISSASLHLIERGTARPNPSTAKAIYEALGVRFDDIFMIDTTDRADDRGHDGPGLWVIDCDDEQL